MTLAVNILIDNINKYEKLKTIKKEQIKQTKFINIISKISNFIKSK